MSEVLEEVIKPADCAIAFGIPTSREAFIVRRQRAAGDSFAFWLLFLLQLHQR